MNKFIVSLALVLAGSIALSSASSDLDFHDTHLPLQLGVHSGLSGWTTRELLRELMNRGVNLNRGSSSLALTSARRGARSFRGNGFGGRFGGLRHGGLAGGFGGSLGNSGFANSQDSLSSFDSNSNNFDSVFADKTQAGLVGAQKGFSKGQHSAAQQENEGLHKHQVINSDKTIIEDHTSGVNDVDSFHNSKGVSQGSHTDANQSALKAALNRGSVQDESINNQHINSLNADRSDSVGSSSGASGAGALTLN